MSAFDAVSTFLGLPLGIPNDERLTMMIERACDPRLVEPDMSLNLDIADHINKKKQNTPHDVSEFLVQLINNRDPKIAMLSLILLDTCIRNCGYAFHLQVSRKEFLNELVKRFPENPPAFPSSVQIKILEFINEWKLGLASQPRFKSDFRKISELHNILLYKGYKFPTVKPDRISTLSSKQALSSAEELEEADNEALSAKLQEHIRRGTPADLVKANELMKLLSGYDREKKPDYQSLVDRQLVNVERSISDLSGKLVPGVEFDRTIQELFNECNSAQAKIQRLIMEEEESDHASRLFELNDKLNELNQQYQNARNGIFSDQPIYFNNEETSNGASDRFELPKSQPVQEESNISLIDLGDDFMSSTPSMGQKPLEPLDLSASSDLMSNNNGFDLLDGLEGLTFDTQPSSVSVTPGPSTPRPIQIHSDNSTPNTMSPPQSSHMSKSINRSDLLEQNEEEEDGQVVKSILLTNDLIRVETTSFAQGKVAYIQFNFHNMSSYKIDQLDLKIAVPKGLNTVISGISGTYLLPKIGHSSLPVEIHYIRTRSDVKYRYILAFNANGQNHTYQGEVQEI